MIIFCHSRFATLMKMRYPQQQRDCRVAEGETMKRCDRKYEVILSEEQRHILRQLISSGAAQPGQPERYDSSYEQGQMCNVFCAKRCG
jgi:hypothetical protein